jgi:hypothetical protein
LNKTWLYLYLPEPMRPHSTAVISKVSFDSIDAWDISEVVIKSSCQHWQTRCPQLWGIPLINCSYRNGIVRYWLEQNHYLFLFTCHLAQSAYRANGTIATYKYWLASMCNACLTSMRLQIKGDMTVNQCHFGVHNADVTIFQCYFEAETVEVSYVGLSKRDLTVEITTVLNLSKFLHVWRTFILW